MELKVREMKPEDIENIVDYFISADEDFLKSMGADADKLPERNQWISRIKNESGKPYEEKKIYYIIWLIDNIPSGHSNINEIEFGISAVMHLHMWRNDNRKAGIGTGLMKLTIPYYFRNFGLKKLICEPYFYNEAPNKVLKKLGFELKLTYDTVPGLISFHQTVNRYELTSEMFDKLFKIR
ncbi:MAG: GNAT family N-acetyltransferase [Bacteroidetes bacterium]|nr:GNAT family N-acetyltransferase [Bacteroidota bacterium]